jgi:hypothetical protein
MQGVAKRVVGFGDRDGLNGGKQTASGQAGHLDQTMRACQRGCTIDRGQAASENANLDPVTVGKREPGIRIANVILAGSQAIVIFGRVVAGAEDHHRRQVGDVAIGCQQDVLIR